MRYNIFDAATGLVLVWLLIPRYGVGGYLFSIAATELLNFSLSAARLARVTGFRLQLPQWVLSAASLAGSWLLLRTLFGALLSHQYEGLLLVLLVLLYLVCFTGVLLLIGGLKKEEILWLLSLLKKDKIHKSANEVFERKTEKTGEF